MALISIAYIAQKTADIDSILLPVWSSGVIDPEIVVPAITSGYAVVVEGGDPVRCVRVDTSGMHARGYVCISGKIIALAIALLPQYSSV